ncbi:hypothetical protein [Paenibacillus alkalitolerans]|uniref:hypothetical protein n=1 Tax=Paenibacillus alkalitolerans TaxID=2799335 RepID=UPI0018F48A04|nr:hypothetical protein [Paenibacillus alkalitolerans]
MKKRKKKKTVSIAAMILANWVKRLRSQAKNWRQRLKRWKQSCKRSQRTSP